MDEAEYTCLRIRFFRTLNSFLDFLRCVCTFFSGGEDCICCGEKSGVLCICKDCIKKLNFSVLENRCEICGKELVSEIRLCSSCRNEQFFKHVDRIYPLWSYRLWRKNLLFSWKTQEKRVLSSLFASFVYKALKEICPEAIFPIIPVPPRPGKIKRKGWDQIDELCFYLKNLYGVRIFPLLRRLSSFQQKKLSKKERLKNSVNSFLLKSGTQINKILKNIPETVILIDDVITTGSTVESCAHELKRLGIKKVLVVSLFIVD